MNQIVSQLIPRIDFLVLDTYDIRVLLIVDNSNWQHLSEESSYIDITTPGRKNAVTHFFRKEKINIYNSNLLELSCEDCPDGLGDLPDGIYEIEVYACEGDKFSEKKYYLRTVKALLRLDQVLINMALNCCLPDKAVMDRYLEIELLLKSAHANLRDGNIKQTSCEYEKAVELLDDFETCVKGTTDLTCKTITKTCS